MAIEAIINTKTGEIITAAPAGFKWGTGDVGPNACPWFALVELEDANIAEALEKRPYISNPYMCSTEDGPKQALTVPVNLRVKGVRVTRNDLTLSADTEGAPLHVDIITESK